VKEIKELYKAIADPGKSMNQNCKDIGDMLGISNKYFMMLVNGVLEPGEALRNRILQLHGQVIKKKRVASYKPRLVVSYDNLDEFWYHKSLSNEERKKAFRLYKESIE
jgi:hypothetical protein